MGVVNCERIFSFSSILKAPMPEIDWLVEPLVAHGNRVMMYGESGCGKSWLMLDLAITLALGKPWLGQFAVPKPRTVLYLDEEMPQTVLQRRLKQLAGDTDTEELLSKHLWFASHLGVNFTDYESTADLLCELQSNGYEAEVILVDTFRQVFTGNENDAGDVGQFWDSIEPIRAAGISLIVSHHMKKPNPQATSSKKHMASGSTNIIAQTDAAFAITRKNKDLLSVECVKSRDIEEPPSFKVTLKDLNDPHPRVELQYIGNEEGIPISQTLVDQGVQHIIDLLEEAEQENYTTHELNKFLGSKGISGKTAERVLIACADQGVLFKVKKGLWRRKETVAVL